MELFTIVLDAGSVFYRGTDKKVDSPLQSLPSWFGDLTTAQSYGSNIFSYRATRRLRLLNITHPIFHADFIAKINVKYEKNPKMKGKILAPLGLPDLETQMQYVAPLTSGNYNDPTKRPRAIDIELPFFGNKHRYSSETPTDKLDILMAHEMKLLYPDHDGYTSPILWPSYHHNGFLHPETCLFNPYTSVTLLETSFQTGGGSSLANEKYAEWLQEYGFTDAREIIRTRVILNEDDPKTTGGKQKKRLPKPKRKARVKTQHT